MGSKNLEDFLNRNVQKHSTTEHKEKEINWEDEKNKWLKAIEEFYSNVEQWLKPFVEKQQIEIKYNEIYLEEENIGKYKTRCMCIHILNEKVILEPIGTLLIGVHGRIDMKGKNGIAKFFWVKENSEGFKINVTIGNEIPLESKENNDQQKLVWKFVTPSPDIRFLFLDADLFADILLGMIQ